MKYIIYSTASSNWYQEKANKAAWFLSQTKGRDNVQIDVKHIRAPKNVETVVDNKKDVRISWEWFNFYFDQKDYDGVGFHFTPYYKRKWRITKNGSKNTINKDYPQFWLCSGKEDAAGYDFLSNFERLILHEISHFDEDVDDGVGNKLTQESVHRWDYELKSIHFYPKQIDYRGYVLKRKVNKVVNQVIDFIRSQI